MRTSAPSTFCGTALEARTQSQARAFHTHPRTHIQSPSSRPHFAALRRSNPSQRCPVVATAVAEPSTNGSASAKATLNVVIVGGGIGGLVLAASLLKRGHQVQVLERDLTAIRGEGKYRGPIQIQSNALAALQALDMEAADRIMEAGCITGDRVNGLCDGLTGEWYCKFDTFHPAVNSGLPVTRVIGRYTLQNILADRVRALGGEHIIINDVHIVGYENDVGSATVVAEDGRRFTGDLVVGADGIRSKVRFQMVGESEANYSQYTCYTGISNFTPADIDTVAYRIFLGNGQYFVSSDVGGGKMQWYAFHKEPAGGDDPEGGRKARLFEIFGTWSDMVTDLIEATPEEDVLRRDIYDRPPVFKWTDGRVALLGDSAHPMQPNLGQGGCMAIEDAFQLSTDLEVELEAAAVEGRGVDVKRVLKGYFSKRVVRAATIHGMAGMAAGMASTYKAYLGEGLGPLEAMTALKIPHPGRVSGQVVVKLTMPSVLKYVLGGYGDALARAGWFGACRIDDQPQGFKESEFSTLLRDDDALLRAARAQWLLQPIAAGPSCLEGNVMEAGEGLVVGRGEGCGVQLFDSSVSAEHARLQRDGKDYFVTDMGSQYGTYQNGRQLEPGQRSRVMPGDVLRFGLAENESSTAENVFRVKLRHESLGEGGDPRGYRRKESDDIEAAIYV